jgi:hypothetical protein
MTKAKQAVVELRKKIHPACEINPSQIVIDLVVEEIGELLNEGSPSRDEVGSCCYKISLIKEIMNPQREKEIAYLGELYTAMDNWSKEIEATNILLGIPRHK